MLTTSKSAFVLKRALAVGLAMSLQLLQPLSLKAQSNDLSLGQAFNMGDITAPKRFRGNVGYGRTNLWQFSLPTNTNQVTITLSDATEFIMAELFQDTNNDGRLQQEEILFQWDRNNPSITSDLEAGTYYIVTNSSSGRTNYQITLTGVPRPAVPAETPGQELASALDLGKFSGVTKVTGFVGKTHPLSFYRFTAETNLDNFTMTFSGLNALSTYISALIFRDSNNDGQYQQQERLLFIDRNNLSSSTALEAGPYYILVDHGSSNSNYQLTLSATSRPASTAAPGADPETALNLGTLGRTVKITGYVGQTHPVSVYRFQLSRARKNFSISLSKTSRYIDIGLYQDRNSDGQLQQNERLLGFGLNPSASSGTTGSLPVAPAGTYYIQVNAGINNSNYLLTIAP